MPSAAPPTQKWWLCGEDFIHDTGWLSQSRGKVRTLRGASQDALNEPDTFEKATGNSEHPFTCWENAWCLLFIQQMSGCLLNTVCSVTEEITPVILNSLQCLMSNRPINLKCLILWVIVIKLIILLLQLLLFVFNGLMKSMCYTSSYI